MWADLLRKWFPCACNLSLHGYNMTPGHKYHGSSKENLVCKVLPVAIATVSRSAGIAAHCMKNNSISPSVVVTSCPHSVSFVLSIITRVLGGSIVIDNVSIYIFQIGKEVKWIFTSPFCSNGNSVASTVCSWMEYKFLHIHSIAITSNCRKMRESVRTVYICSLSASNMTQLLTCCFIMY